MTALALTALLAGCNASTPDRVLIETLNARCDYLSKQARDEKRERLVEQGLKPGTRLVCPGDD